MRKWQIKLEFETKSIYLSSFKLADMTAFVKQNKLKDNKKSLYKIGQFDKLLVEMVFDRAIHIHPNENLVKAIIIKG